MSIICAIGELLIDFTPMGLSNQGNNIYEQNPGGGPANVAVATSMLGLPTSFIGKVGNDGFGHELKQAMMEKKVDVSSLAMTDKCHTTLAFVHLDDDGDRSFTFYRKSGADILLSEDDIDFLLIDDCQLLHFSSVSLTDEPSRSTTIKAVKYAKEKGKLISYDPNLRELLWDNLETAKEVITSMLPFADILKISEEELLFLTGEENMVTGCKKLQQLGITLIFTTLGKKGSMFLYKDLTGNDKTYDVKVTDTTGCGDSFMGAIIYKVMNREMRLVDISLEELHEISDFANGAGSLTAMKKGGVPAMPTCSDVKKLQNEVSKL